MATTKIINDLIDLNQTGNTTALKGCVGTNAQQPATPTISVEYLVVGGGGGGGGFGQAGGGGAGGLSTGTIAVPNNTAVNIVIGQGGAGGTGALPATGANGQDSGFYTIQGQGGGGSQGHEYGGLPGGSGGGSATLSTGATGNPTGGAGVSGQGNAGGTAVIAGYGGNPYSGSGGGGAGAPGTGGNNVDGDGGIGSTTAIISTTNANASNANIGEQIGGSLYFAGGGGGGAYGSTCGDGGYGGGGDGNVGGGTHPVANNGYPGTINTGGGGGGVGSYGPDTNTGGSGGSGVVILRFASSTTYSVTGITVGNAFTEGSGATEKTVLVFKSGSGTINLKDTSLPGPKVGDLRTNTNQTSANSASAMEHYMSTGWRVFNNYTTSVCNYPTTATALYQLESNITNTCGTATASWSGTPAYSTSIKKYGTASAGLFTGGASGNYIDSGVDPDSSTSWSVSFWMYRTNTGNFNYAFGTLSTNAGAADGLILGFYNSGSSGMFDVVWRSGTTTTFRSQGGTTIQDTWINIIITHDSSGSGSTAYYKNGTLVTPNATYSNPFAGTQTSASNFIFGSAGKFPSERLDGYIDQIRIFPSVLTASQITELYNETSF